MTTSTRYDDDALGLPSAAPRMPRLELVFSGLQIAYQAIAEGFAASRRYHELTSRGMTHQEAASKVFLEHFDPL